MNLPCNAGDAGSYDDVSALLPELRIMASTELRVGLGSSQSPALNQGRQARARVNTVPLCLGQSWFTRILVQLFTGLPFVLKSVVGENYCASLVQYREPLVRRQGSQVSMRVARGSAVEGRWYRRKNLDSGIRHLQFRL